MKKLGIALALAGLLGAARLAGADTRNGMFESTGNPSDGLFGFHAWGTDLVPRGFSFDGNSTSNPIWGLGLVRGGGSDGDLYLQSYAVGLNMLEMRGDAGELWVGTGIGHPSTGVQFTVTAGTSAAPRDAVAAAVYGDQNGLGLYQWQSGTQRSKLNFNNDFLLGTDMGKANVADFFLQDVTTPGAGHYPLWISAASGSNPDMVNIGYGATITGATTLNGSAALLGATTTVANTLQHTGNQLSFYNSAPVTQQTVTGCRSDGTALASLITALAKLGLIKDMTTP